MKDPHELPPHHREIVVAAMEDRGRFHIAVRADTFGKAVRTKDVRFFDADDRELARRYVDAVRDLERLLLVRQSGNRDCYELTNFGWLFGRKLLQEHRELLVNSKFCRDLTA